MGVDANNWKPQLVEREEQAFITAVPQRDGTIKYFQGNPDVLGTIDTVRVLEPGKYRKGVVPKVQLIDADGNDIPNNNGASFRVIITTKGDLIDVEMGMGGDGSGFTSDMDIRFVVDDPKDCYKPAVARALINTGEWIENMTADQVDAHNAHLRAQHEVLIRRGLEKNRGVMTGSVDYKGKKEGTVTRDSIKGLPTL